MKTSILLLPLLLSVPAYAQPTPTAPAKFDWKLRLSKGQTWTQTLRSTVQFTTSMADPRTKKTSHIASDITQGFTFKNEVIDQTADYSLVRMTYTAFDQKVKARIDGKSGPQPATPDVSRAFVGASFSIKQAPDGRVIEVSGLDDFVARQRKMFASITKDLAARKAIERFLPTAGTLRATIIKNQSVALPKMPLAIGGSYTYGAALPTSFPVPVSVSGKRTLRAFDGTTATFDESGTFSVAPTKPIEVGGNRTYIAMTGEISGQTIVDARSGLVQSARTTTRIRGRVTAVAATGHRVSAPIDATSQTTLSTQSAPVVGVPR